MVKELIEKEREVQNLREELASLHQDLQMIEEALNNAKENQNGEENGETEEPKEQAPSKRGSSFRERHSQGRFSSHDEHFSILQLKEALLTNKELREKIGSLLEENGLLKKEKETTQERLNQREESEKKLMIGFKGLQKDIEEWKSKHDSLLVSKNSLEVLNERLQNDFIKSGSELKTAHQRLLEENSKLQEVVENSSKEIGRLRKLLEESESESAKALQEMRFKLEEMAKNDPVFIEENDKNLQENTRFIVSPRNKNLVRVYCGNDIIATGILEESEQNELNLFRSSEVLTDFKERESGSCSRSSYRDNITQGTKRTNDLKLAPGSLSGSQLPGSKDAQSNSIGGKKLKSYLTIEIEGEGENDWKKSPVFQINSVKNRVRLSMIKSEQEPETQNGSVLPKEKAKGEFKELVVEEVKEVKDRKYKKEKKEGSGFFCCFI